MSDILPLFARCGVQHPGCIGRDHECETSPHDAGFHVCGICAHWWPVTA